MSLAYAVMAADEEPATQLSGEDYYMVQEAMEDYNFCIEQSALSQMAGSIRDPRVIADHAMKSCADSVTSLHQTLTEKNQSPKYNWQVINRMINRSVNKLLSQLMVYMATQP